MTTRVQSWLSQMDQDELDFGVHAIHRHRASIVQAVGLECRPDSPLLGAEYISHHMGATDKALVAETDYNHALNALMTYDSDDDEDASEKGVDEHSTTESTKNMSRRVDNEEDLYLAPLPSEVTPSVSKSNSWSSVSSAFPLTPTSASMRLASFVNSSASSSRVPSRSRASSNASAFYVGEDAPPSPSITMSRQPSTYFGTELSSRPTSYASLRKRESTPALPSTNASPTVPNFPGRRLGFPSHKSMGVLRTDSASIADTAQSINTPPPSIASSRQRSRTVSTIYRNAVYLETEDTVAALQQRLSELDAAFRNPVVTEHVQDAAPVVSEEQSAAAQETLLRQPASHWSPGSSTTSVDKMASAAIPPTPLSPFSLASFSRTPRSSFMGPSVPLPAGPSVIAEEPTKKSKTRRRFTSFMSKMTMPSPAINETFSSDIPPMPSLPLNLPTPIDESKDFMLMVDSTPAEELSDPFAAMPVSVQGTPGTRSRAGSDANAPTVPSRLSKESTPFPTLPEILDEPLPSSPRKSRFSMFHPGKSVVIPPMPPTPALELESFERRARRTSSTFSLKSKPSPAFASQKKISSSRPPSPHKSVKSQKKSRMGKIMHEVFRDTFPAPQ